MFFFGSVLASFYSYSWFRLSLYLPCIRALLHVFSVSFVFFSYLSFLRCWTIVHYYVITCSKLCVVLYCIFSVQTLVITTGLVRLVGLLQYSGLGLHSCGWMTVLNTD